jgi:excisionase family DNA binding protein
MDGGRLPSCGLAHKRVPCVVLDLFCGTGTTGVVAMRLNRRFCRDRIEDVEMNEMDVMVRPRYLSPKQAAVYLGLSVFSVYRLVERRAIPFVPLYPSGKAAQTHRRPSVRFDVEALDGWMKKQTVKPLAEFLDERTMK